MPDVICVVPSFSLAIFSTSNIAHCKYGSVIVKLVAVYSAFNGIACVPEPSDAGLVVEHTIVITTVAPAAIALVIVSVPAEYVYVTPAVTDILENDVLAANVNTI